MQKIYAKEINYAPATGEFELYLASEVDALINTPHTADFMQAVHLEAAHQRDRWGTNHDAGKTDADWFWLIGYLAGKAIRPDATPEKRLHHIITTAAACLNWHAARTGADTRMRPGIEPPCSAKETPAARPCVWRTGCKHQAVCDKQNVCVPGGEETSADDGPDPERVCSDAVPAPEASLVKAFERSPRRLCFFCGHPRDHSEHSPIGHPWRAGPVVTEGERFAWLNPTSNRR